MTEPLSKAELRRAQAAERKRQERKRKRAGVARYALELNQDDVEKLVGEWDCDDQAKVEAALIKAVRKALRHA